MVVFNIKSRLFERTYLTIQGEFGKMDELGYTFVMPARFLFTELNHERIGEARVWDERKFRFTKELI